MNKKEIFEYFVYQLLDKYKEKALKELTMQKHGEDVDLEWRLEDACAGDFTSAMEKLGIISFNSLPRRERYLAKAPDGSYKVFAQREDAENYQKEIDTVSDVIHLREVLKDEE